MIYSFAWYVLYLFVSVIGNVMPWFAILVATITQFPDQFRSRVISQLIKVIAGVFQKLLRYFNGTIISTISVPLSPVSHVNFTLRLNESVI